MLNWFKISQVCLNEKKVKSSSKLKEKTPYTLLFKKICKDKKKLINFTLCVYVCIESYIKLITNFKLQILICKVMWKIYSVKPRKKTNSEFTSILHQRSKIKGITAGSCRKCKQKHVFVGRAVKYHAGSLTCHELFCIRFLQILYIIYMLLK